MAVGKNFVVKNGLEVSDRLIYADSVTYQVGINTTLPDYDLHVINGIGCTDITITRNASISGILTANELNFTGETISIGGSTGSTGQYLRSTGSGVEWASFPTNLRSTYTYTATEDQTVFPYAYNVGFLDVYINGVKLKGDGVTDITEYTASNGTSVVISEPCFEGDTVEFVAYNPVAIAAGGNGILGFTIQEEGSTIGNDNGVSSINFVGASVTAVGSGAGVTVYITSSGAGTTFTGAASTITTLQIQNWNTTYSWGNHNTQGYLTSYTETDTLQDVLDRGNTAISDVVVTGIITATRFSGDGSGLIGVVGSGSGVIIKDSGSLVGTAGTIDFGANLTVSPISSGVVTVTASGGDSYWSSTAAGIHTLSNVGIGTTNSTSALTVKGNTSLETLNVSGVSTFSNTIEVGTGKSLNFGSAGSQYLKLYSDGSNTYINQSNMGKLIIDASGTQRTLEITDSQASQTMAKFIGNGGAVELYHNNSKKFETLGAGVTVTGTTFTNQLNVSGVSTFQNDIKVAEYSYGTNSNQITLGNNKFRIYSDSSNTYLKNYDSNIGGDLYIESDEILIRKYDGTETIAQFTEGAGVKLNYQGATKLQTTNNGILVGGITLTDQLIVSGNTELTGVTTFKGPIYETVTNNFNSALTPSVGILTVSTTNSSVLVGTLGSSVTTWAFTGVNTSNSSLTTLTAIIDSDSLYTYGDSCTVNGIAVSGGIRWPGGIPPLSTNNEDILTFTIVTDNSSQTRVYGSYQLNYS
jgi:hypothetical protein